VGQRSISWYQWKGLVIRNEIDARKPYRLPLLKHVVNVKDFEE
jgi:hypothetical protein